MSRSVSVDLPAPGRAGDADDVGAAGPGEQRLEAPRWPPGRRRRSGASAGRRRARLRRARRWRARRHGSSPSSHEISPGAMPRAREASVGDARRSRRARSARPTSCRPARRGARGRCGRAPAPRRTGSARRGREVAHQLEVAGGAGRGPQARSARPAPRSRHPCGGAGASSVRASAEPGLERTPASGTSGRVKGVPHLVRRRAPPGGRRRHPEPPCLSPSEWRRGGRRPRSSARTSSEPGRRTGRAPAPRARRPLPASRRDVRRRSLATSCASSVRQLGDLVHSERRQAHQLGRVDRDEQLLGHGQGDGRDGPAGQRVHHRALEREHHLGACRPLLHREPELREPIRVPSRSVSP